MAGVTDNVLNREAVRLPLGRREPQVQYTSVAILLESWSLRFRRMAGRCYGQSHPMRAFHFDMAEMLDGVGKQYRSTPPRPQGSQAEERVTTEVAPCQGCYWHGHSGQS